MTYILPQHFYTAPTAIRALKRLGDDWVNKYDLSSLRAIGTVGGMLRLDGSPHALP